MMGKKRLLALTLTLLASSLSCGVMYELACASQGGVWVESEWDDDFYIAAHCDTNDDKDEGQTSEGNSAQEADSQEAVQGPKPAASQHAPVELADPAECNASQFLYVNVSEPEIKDTSNETRCTYTITYTNSGDQQIWVYLHKRHKGADTEVEDTWKNYYSLDPGESLEMSYRTLLYKEASTTWIDVITEVAPIYATEGCKNTFKNDTAPRAQIGYPVDVPCE